jgi:hypothetical protein
MDRKTVGILGVVAGLATVTPALVQPASASDALKASSYADLLKPVTNAAELLALDMSRQDTPSEADQSPRYQPVYYHHHHHHHHHHHRRRHYY